MDALLTQLSPELRQSIEAKFREEKSALELENKLLREYIRRLKQEKYGVKSEQLSAAQIELLELEPGVHQAEVRTEAILSAEEKQEVAAILNAEEVKAPKKEKKPHRGRVELPAHLPRVEKVLPCTPDQCHCRQCGAEKMVIGYEESQELGMKPLELYVQITKREKRACKHCEEQGVSTAPVEAKIVPKSKGSNELLVQILIWKYVEHLPLYRIAARFLREHRVELSLVLLCGWVMRMGDLCKSIVTAMRAELLNGDYIQADETPVAVQTGRTPGKNHQAYLWEYSRPAGPVIFDFQIGRGREGPRKFLGQYAKVLQCDGYNAYDKIGGEQIIFAGCWAHARRGFVNAVKAAGKDPVALAIVAKINALYRVEREARRENLPAQERYKLRQEKSLRQMAPLRAAIEEAQKTTTPASTLGKACSYALNQWKRLQVYLQHGQVEIDQNLCENAIRPVALGRKNWLHIGSEMAGPKVAAIISVIETCRRLNIDVKEYLLDVLPGLSEQPTQKVPTLTPMAWAKTHAKIAD